MNRNDRADDKEDCLGKNYEKQLSTTWSRRSASVGSSERPLRIIRDYRTLTLPLHLRKRGRCVLPNMMQVMNAITPFMKQPRRSPTPDVMSAGYLH